MPGDISSPLKKADRVPRLTPTGTRAEIGSGFAARTLVVHEDHVLVATDRNTTAYSKAPKTIELAALSEETIDVLRALGYVAADK